MLSLLLLIMARTATGQVEFPEYIEHAESNKPLIHVDQFKGSYWQVDSIADRDAISDLKRAVGMVVTYSDTSGDLIMKRYEGPNVTNTEWTDDTNWELVTDVSYLNDTLLAYFDTTAVLGRISDSLDAQATLWKNDGNYIYNNPLGDSVGIGTATPSEQVEISDGLKVGNKFLAPSDITFINDFNEMYYNSELTFAINSNWYTYMSLGDGYIDAYTETVSGDEYSGIQMRDDQGLRFDIIDGNYKYGSEFKSSGTVLKTNSNITTKRGEIIIDTTDIAFNIYPNSVTEINELYITKDTIYTNAYLKTTHSNLEHKVLKAGRTDTLDYSAVDKWKVVALDTLYDNERSKIGYTLLADSTGVTVDYSGYMAFSGHVQLKNNALTQEGTIYVKLEKNGVVQEAFNTSRTRDWKGGAVHDVPSAKGWISVTAGDTLKVYYRSTSTDIDIESSNGAVFDKTLPLVIWLNEINGID